MKVDKKKLEDIHKEFTETLLHRARDKAATAADLNVIRQFLKDNAVQGVPVEDSPLANLADELPVFDDAPTPTH